MYFPFSSIKKIFLKRNCMLEQLVFFITNRCNMRCKHCFYSKKLNTFPDPTIDEINKISKNIGRFNFLTLTGGEPFLRRDIIDIIECFVENNKLHRVSIPTNGYLTDKIVNTTKRILKKVKDTKVYVKISLDGEKDIHNKIRRKKNAYKNAIDSLKKLRRLEREYENFYCGVIFTFNKANQHNLKVLYKKIKKETPPSVAAVNLIRGNVVDNSLKEINFDKYKEFYNILLDNFKIKAQNSIKDSFYFSYKKELYKLIEEIYCEKRNFKYCYAGKLIGVIDSDLKVYPCESLKISLGNLKNNDYDFQKIWFSEKTKKIMSKIIDRGCYCTHECNLQINMFFNFSIVFRILLRALKERFL